MYYELYVDSLLLLNFCMNLYLLLLVNQKTHCTATRGRLLSGAVLSSVLYCLPFLCTGAVWLRFGAGMFLGMAVMVFVPFRIRTFKALQQVVVYFLKYSFLLGGCVLLVLRIFSSFFVGFSQVFMGSAGIMSVGAVVFVLFFYRRQDVGAKNRCKVIVKHRGRTVTADGFWDSGNGLVEPISGEPVCVVDQEIMMGLWDREPELFRAVPYHSIGKTGVLKGFCVEELWVEVDGLPKCFPKVYLAPAPEEMMVSSILLNPGLLEKNKNV